MDTEMCQLHQFKPLWGFTTVQKRHGYISFSDMVGIVELRCMVCGFLVTNKECIRILSKKIPPELMQPPSNLERGGMPPPPRWAIMPETIRGEDFYAPGQPTFHEYQYVEIGRGENQRPQLGERMNDFEAYEQEFIRHERDRVDRLERDMALEQLRMRQDEVDDIAVQARTEELGQAANNARASLRRLIEEIGERLGIANP